MDHPERMAAGAQSKTTDQLRAILVGYIMGDLHVPQDVLAAVIGEFLVRYDAQVSHMIAAYGGIPDA